MISYIKLKTYSENETKIYQTNEKGPFRPSDQAN